MIGGGSVIIGPLGNVLAGPLLDGEGILSAVVDLDDIIRGKFDLDVAVRTPIPLIRDYSWRLRT